MKRFECRTNKVILSRIVCGVALSAVGAIGLLGCVTNGYSSPSRLTEMDDQIEARGMSEAKMIQYSSSQVPGLSLRELAEGAELIVAGEVMGRSEPFLVKPVDGADPKFFEDIYIRLDDVFAGTPAFTSEQNQEDSVITVRSEGGMGEVVATVNDATPVFEEGQSYLLFLYQRDDGAYFNTEGNHYYVVGVMVGAWLEDEGVFESPIFQPDGLQSLSKESVADWLATIPAVVGADQEFLGVNGSLDKIKAEYDAGVLSEEAYQFYLDLAQEEASGYATILSAKEQRAYEEAVLAAA